MKWQVSYTMTVKQNWVCDVYADSEDDAREKFRLGEVNDEQFLEDGDAKNVEIEEVNAYPKDELPAAPPRLPERPGKPEVEVSLDGTNTNTISGAVKIPL
jgi:hypothetical protein